MSRANLLDLLLARFPKMGRSELFGLSIGKSRRGDAFPEKLPGPKLKTEIVRRTCVCQELDAPGKVESLEVFEVLEHVDAGQARAVEKVESWGLSFFKDGLAVARSLKT